MRLKYKLGRPELMRSRELLIELVRTRDRTTLGCVDDCPPGTAWIDFVALTDVVRLDGGKFFHEYDQIDVYREGAPPDPQESPLAAAAASQRPIEEVVWLAHELGHLQSKLRGSVFPPSGAERTYAEELRAWYFAKRLLVEKEFADWDIFDTLRTQGLVSYREYLNLTEQQLLLATEIATDVTGV